MATFNRLIFDTSKFVFTNKPTRIDISLRRINSTDSFVQVPDSQQSVVVNEQATIYTIPVVASSDDSLYEINIYSKQGQMFRAFFAMPDDDVFLHDLELWTAYPSKQAVIRKRFLDLDDTPDSFSEHENKYMTVQSGRIAFAKELDASTVLLNGVELPEKLNEMVDVAASTKADATATLQMFGLKANVADVFNKTELMATKQLQDANIAAGGDGSGLLDALLKLANGRTQRDKNAERISVLDCGAVGDGILRPVSDWYTIGTANYRKYANLAAVQVDYPHVVSATDAIDWAGCQKAIDTVGKGGTVYFSQTPVNNYITNKPLKFYSGQSWRGCGGVDVAAGTGKGTRITLVAAATSVAEPKDPTVTTYAFNPIGIYFNAQNYGDAGLSLYNTSYAKVDHCAAAVTKAGAAAFLLDSDTSKQCYFNILTACRGFATAANSVVVRFTRGANANQIIGGKFGSSVRALEFLSLSSGNLVLGTDFEDNSDRHIYVDAPNNVFIGTHMESAPVGFDITANGTNTQRMNTTYASTVVVSVQDVSRIGTVLDTRVETSSTKGDLRFGPTRFLSEYLTSVSRNDFDLDLVSSTANSLFRMFLNTNTTGQRRLTLYKGDGTTTESIRLDAATGEIVAGDISQTSATGIVRKTVRAAAVPTTGTYSAGDTVNRTNPTSTAPVTQWTCVAAGTPGTWQASAWVVGKGTTSSRPSISANDIGVQYFDTTLAAAGKPIWWTGSAWVDATGTVV